MERQKVASKSGFRITGHELEQNMSISIIRCKKLGRVRCACYVRAYRAISNLRSPTLLRPAVRAPPLAMLPRIAPQSNIAHFEISIHELLTMHHLTDPMSELMYELCGVS